MGVKGAQVAFLTVNMMPRWVDVIEAFRVGENARINEAVDHICTVLCKNEEVKVYKCISTLPELLSGNNRSDVILDLFNSHYWDDRLKPKFPIGFDDLAFSLRSPLEDVLMLAHKMKEETPKGANEIINKIPLLLPYSNS